VVNKKSVQKLQGIRKFRVNPCKTITMKPARKNTSQSSFFFSLRDTLDARRPLYILAGRVDWALFEEAFTPLYCDNNGRPGKPIRLMTGLLILKHIRNVSDERVVEEWRE